MLKTIWIGLLLNFFSLVAISQNYMISGRIFDVQTNESLSGAHVYLVNELNEIDKVSITDSSGKFIFEQINSGNYLIKATFLGYETLTWKINLSDKDVNLGRLSLKQKSTELEEVEIKGKIPIATLIGDTTQYNADAFKVTKDATAEDLVEKLPGVVIDNDKVQAQGEDVKEVLVDGRPFFGNDPTAALKTLPAEVIDKIQVFDKQSDQARFTGFDDGETTKTLNLVTRPSMRNGTFGKISSGSDFNETYMVNGNINFFKGSRRITILAQSNNINQQNFSNDDLLGVLSSQNSRGGMRSGGMRGGGRSGGRRGNIGGRSFSGGGTDVGEFLVGKQNGISKTNAFGINYMDVWGRKLDVTASYFFNRSNNHSLENLNREYFLSVDSGQLYIELDESNSIHINHRMNARIEYTINDKNTILFRPRIAFQANDGVSDLFGQTFFGENLLNQTDNIFNSDFSAINSSNSLLYRHKFNKERRTISTFISGGYNNKAGESLLSSYNSYFEEPLFTDILEQNSDLDAYGWNISGNIMYTEPVGKNSMLQLNYRTSYQWEDSDKATFNFDGVEQRYSIFDTTLSNIFQSNYNTQEIGTGYLFRLKKFMFTVRVSYQSAKLFKEQAFPDAFSMEKTYNNILGMGIMRYRFSQKMNLFLMYRTYTSPPSIDQLIEVVDNTNPIQLTIGNPDLNPSYQHNFALRFSRIKPESSTVFFALLAGGYKKNYIGNNTFYAYTDTLINNRIFLQEGSQITKPVNLNGYWNMRSFITLGLPFNVLKSNININLTANYTHIPGLIHDEINYSNNGLIGIGIVLSSNISEKLDFTISSRTNYNKVNNTIQTELNANYFSQTSKIRFKWIFWKGFVFETNLNHKLYIGLSEEFDQDYWLWNVGIGKKIFKNQRGEIKLSIYDILKQNNSISRNINEFYYEDIQTQVLKQYLLLSFTYNIRNFSEAPPTNNSYPLRRNFRGPAREE